MKVQGSQRPFLLSSFYAEKLDTKSLRIDTGRMGWDIRSARHRSITHLVRQRIENGGERLWRLEDFRDQSFMAVAQALSRLTRDGIIERLSKGIYFRPRATAFGKSLPNPAHIQKLASLRNPVFPAGISAASLLGFTTQTAGRVEVATTALSLPRKLMGSDTIIHTRRPEAWAGLSDVDAALLDFLDAVVEPANCQRRRQSDARSPSFLKRDVSSVSPGLPHRSRRACAR